MIGATEIARILPDPAMRAKVLRTARDFLLRSFWSPDAWGPKTSACTGRSRFVGATPNCHIRFRQHSSRPHITALIPI